LPADISDLASPLFEIASGAFFRLRKAGPGILPDLLRAESRNDPTPFGRIAERPEGLVPEPVSPGEPALPLRDVVRLLIVTSD
jgi:hypothetical protein